MHMQEFMFGLVVAFALVMVLVPEALSALGSVAAGAFELVFRLGFAVLVVVFVGAVSALLYMLLSGASFLAA